MTISATLNEGQLKAGEAFFEFLFSDDPEFAISGPPGVGKSFWTTYIIDEVMPRYHQACQLLGMKAEFDAVDISATTNKAAEVLAQSTKRPTSTIHSLMNLKVQDDYKTGVSKIVPTRGWKVHQRKIIFIDESSMIDRGLLAYLDEGTEKCKRVYIGDRCQLAPVMEKVSPVYNRKMPFFELTQPMRTSDPALLALNNQLRDTVLTGEFKPIQLVPGSIDLLDDSQADQLLRQVYADPHHSHRILAYTNARVIAYNDYLRGIRQLPAEYTVGEHLISSSACHMTNRMLSVEEEVQVLDLAKHTTMISIEDAELEVRYATLQSAYGDVFLNVPLPVNRHHYRDLVRYFGRQKNWYAYYELTGKYPDLRPRDASTVYKAQGSTFDTVFIDLANISTCHQPEQVARMLYVAFSRARHRVYLYGQLAEKYGGLIL